MPIRKDKNIVASSLFGVAAIQALVGAMGWYLYRDHFTLLDWVVTFGGGIYLALGMMAWGARLPAAIAGAALYGTFLALQASQGMDLLLTGLIFKVPIVILLLIAVLVAVRRAPSRVSQGASS